MTRAELAQVGTGRELQRRLERQSNKVAQRPQGHIGNIRAFDPLEVV